MLQPENQIFPKKFYTHLDQPHAVVAWMNQVNGPHQLFTPHPKEIDFFHHGITVGDTTIGTIQYSTLVNIEIENLQHCYVFNVPLEGEQEIRVKSSVVYSSDQVAAIFSPDQPFSMLLQPNCQKKMIRLSKHKIEQHISHLLGYKIQKPLIFDIQAPMQGQIKDWFNLVLSLEGFLSHCEQFADFQNIWHNFEHNLISILIHAQPHNYSLELQRRLEGKPNYLNYIDSIFKDNLSKPFSLAELEKILSISRERLYQDFHTYFGQSPVAYLRQLRFEETYKRLKDIKPWENISMIAMDCGFQQLGRFSKEYKERFGELPSETLKKYKH